MNQPNPQQLLSLEIEINRICTGNTTVSAGVAKKLHRLLETERQKAREKMERAQYESRLGGIEYAQSLLTPCKTRGGSNSPKEGYKACCPWHALDEEAFAIKHVALSHPLTQQPQKE